MTTRRVLTVGLWAYSFWYLGAMLAGVAGYAPLIGPALALLATAVAVRVTRPSATRVAPRRQSGATQTSSI